MNTVPITTAPADHDEPYVFGNPPAYYLNTHEHARLVLLRSRIDDACRHLGRRELQGRVIESRVARASIVLHPAASCC